MAMDLKPFIFCATTSAIMPSCATVRNTHLLPPAPALLVMSGCVETVTMSGFCAFSITGMIAIVEPLQTSPSITSTRSWLSSFSALATPSAGRQALSCIRNTSLRPSGAPFWLISSIASSAPHFMC